MDEFCSGSSVWSWAAILTMGGAERSGLGLCDSWEAKSGRGCTDTWLFALGEPPRPDELPHQPHPYHPWGDSVHSSQQGAGAGCSRCLCQGG